MLVGAKALISDSSTDNFKTGNDGRCCGSPPGRHLPELKSWQSGYLLSREREDCEAISRAAAIYTMAKACSCLSFGGN